MPASTILLVESDEAFARTIATGLTGVGYTVVVEPDANAAIGRIAASQLVIIDLVSGEKSAIDLCREIRANPAMASIPVLCVSQADDVEDRIRFLEAGADDVVAKPFDAREIEARVEALLLRFQRSKDLTAVVSKDGLTVTRTHRIVAVHSPKGGVGTSTVATNIAMASARRRPDRVVIVDLDLQFGQIATHLNLIPRQTLADVVRDEAAVREPELLRTYATRHDSGLHVLAAPSGPEIAQTITANHVDRILTTLLQSYDQVVVDTGSWLDERTLRVFEHANNIVFVLNPEIPALKAMSALVEYLSESGTVANKSMFVLNNTFGREILKVRDVETALGTKVEMELPYDPFLYLKAVNEGIPIILGAPQSAAAQKLVALSDTAFGANGVGLPPPAAEKKKGRFALRRR
ncbi:MAG TPA: response regulator [Candidatus Limnocylindrales bacterium]|nr:response regulator [Candidatus Limnocylindrales bacterium]